VSVLSVLLLSGLAVFASLLYVLIILFVISSTLIFNFFVSVDNESVKSFLITSVPKFKPF
jgi:hypothetical protein